MLNVPDCRISETRALIHTKYMKDSAGHLVMHLGTVSPALVASWLPERWHDDSSTESPGASGFASLCCSSIVHCSQQRLRVTLACVIVQDAEDRGNHDIARSLQGAYISDFEVQAWKPQLCKLKKAGSRLPLGA